MRLHGLRRTSRASRRGKGVRHRNIGLDHRILDHKIKARKIRDGLKAIQCSSRRRLTAERLALHILARLTRGSLGLVVRIPEPDILETATRAPCLRDT
jgi:hypothetical protein